MIEFPCYLGILSSVSLNNMFIIFSCLSDMGMSTSSNSMDT